MQLKNQFFGSWALYISFGTCYKVNICSCVLLAFINRYINITMLDQFCTMYEKCIFMSMVYISQL